MTQKDNVKQLIGKSLNAYNNKVLQQIDRIEKKNKQQNHKISMLTNELDNDYLTKSEEGSVISLEHSKEGMVYLDELQGNTLVNYCTDGSKELTLNGDIDLEGTFVTTTEGVDNGKVDVMCEGNTLVGEFLRIPTPNLQGNEFDDFTIVDKNDYWECRGIANKDNVVMSVNSWSCELGLKALKEGVEYTVIVYDCPSNSMMKNYLIRDNNIGENFNTVIGVNKWKIVAKSEGLKYGFYSFSKIVNLGEECIINFPKKVLLLEGDWTNRDIPASYFEGMKSVGQDDENGHKIEILSQNKNLCTVSSYSGVCHNKIESNIPCKKNTVYTLTFKDESDLNQSGNRGITLITHKTKTDKNDHGSIYTYAMNEGGKEYTFRKSGFTFNTSDCCYISLTSNNMSSVPNLIIKEIQIEEGLQTSYNPQILNKKEILINEPLRGFEVGKKDRFIKIGDKCFIERSCILYDYSEFNWSVSNEEGDDFIRAFSSINEKLSSPITKCSTLMSFNIKQAIGYKPQKNGVWVWNTENDQNYIYISLEKTKLSSLNSDGIKEWCRNNSLFVLCQLATPIYEPLEIEPTLNTYNDITHISNNSIIPCNMKIQNTGYNAIIKPSTLYTVALDTDKSGTIGMNLGGAKGTTTNNVLTLTTPATLADDSLRLYGKGIKGSKVRILEGDKTNWIPSHFEGMKSSFEDKLQDDGTYKMEIISNNQNLFDNTKIPDYTGGDMRYYKGYGGLFKRIENKEYILGNYGGMAFILNLPKNKTYKISIKVRNSNGSNTKIKSNIFLNKEIIGHTKTTFTTNVTENVIGFGVVNYNENTDLILYDVILSEVIDNYIEGKSNKIQFSSIEPLRKWDRFVFKDNQLMIERGSGTFVLNNKNGYSLSAGGWENKTDVCTFERYNPTPTAILNNLITFYNDSVPSLTFSQQWSESGSKGREGISTHQQGGFVLSIKRHKLISQDVNGLDKYLRENPIKVTYKLETPTYEEIPFELQKIILEGYENGTLFFDTNIPPTSTITYAGETPIVSAIKTNKSNVISNTQDINDNIIPYLMDMDYRVVCLQLATEEIEGGVSMAKLFGGTYEMLKRDIQSNRLSKEEYGYRLTDYFNAGKLTEEEVRELEDLI